MDLSLWGRMDALTVKNGETADGWERNLDEKRGEEAIHLDFLRPVADKRREAVSVMCAIRQLKYGLKLQGDLF